MSTNKIVSLQRYIADLEQRLSAKEVPLKHQDSVVEYRQWLQIELTKHKNRLEKLILNNTKVK